jgi:hypothetical protein
MVASKPEMLCVVINAAIKLVLVDVALAFTVTITIPQH